MPRGVYDRSHLSNKQVFSSTKAKVAKELEAFVFDTPEFLKTFTQRGKRGLVIAKMGESLRAMPKEKCLVFTVKQLEEQLGSFHNFKQIASLIRVGLKKAGLENPRCVIDGDRLFIFKNS
jgi:hypothetical protein